MNNVSIDLKDIISVVPQSSLVWPILFNTFSNYSSFCITKVSFPNVNDDSTPSSFEKSVTLLMKILKRCSAIFGIIPVKHTEQSVNEVWSILQNNKKLSNMPTRITANLCTIFTTKKHNR